MMIPQQKPRPDETVELIADAIRSRLPNTWSDQTSTSRTFESGIGQIDSVLTVYPPNDRALRILIEVQSIDTSNWLDTAINRMVRIVTDTANDGRPPIGLIAAAYLSPAARSRIADRDLSYADATGNLRLTASKPVVYLEASGANKNPWPKSKGIVSLKGPATGSAIRALLDFRPPYGIRELAERSSVSPATLSRVVDLLSQEGLVNRTSIGGVDDSDWRGILRRWTVDYSMMVTNQSTSYLAPRGLDQLWTALADTSTEYAASGTKAIPPDLRVAPSRLGIVYTTSERQLATEADLRRVDEGANVILLRPFDQVAIKRCRNVESIRVVALSQLAADLRTGPGRAPAEAEELVEWMGSNEGEWRA